MTADANGVLIGYMYQARRPCGRVSAAAWDEPRHADTTAASVQRWRERGDTVERVARHLDEPLPEWTCCAGACREAALEPSL